MIAFKSKQLWTDTVESWRFQNGMQMKNKSLHFEQVKSISIPRITTPKWLRPSHRHHISCRCFHRFSSFHSTAHLGVCRRLAEGLCWKVPWKRLKKARCTSMYDVCSYGFGLMFLLQHSAPHYFGEPIVHGFESKCHAFARRFVTFVYPNPSLDIFIMGGKWGHWKTHTHTPKHPESRNVDLDPSLPSCRRQKNGPWNDIPMARVATLGRGGVDILLMTTTWKRFYVQGPHSPFSQGLQFSG